MTDCQHERCSQAHHPEISFITCADRRRRAAHVSLPRSLPPTCAILFTPFNELLLTCLSKVAEMLPVPKITSQTGWTVGERAGLPTQSFQGSCHPIHFISPGIPPPAAPFPRYWPLSTLCPRNTPCMLSLPPCHYDTLRFARIFCLVPFNLAPATIPSQLL